MAQRKRKGGLPARKIGGKRYISTTGNFTTKKNASTQANKIRNYHSLTGRLMWNARVVGDRKKGYRVYQRRKSKPVQIQKKVKGKLPRTIKNSKRQVGTTTKLQDKKRKALKPGRRISKSGREYNENRKNRSDLKGGV